MQAAIEGFLASFVRPHGLDRDATPVVTDVIEEVAAQGATKPLVPAVWSLPLRALMWPLAAWLRARYDAMRVMKIMRALTRSKRPRGLARHDAEAHG
jgi:hypothetical protein